MKRSSWVLAVILIITVVGALSWVVFGSGGFSARQEPSGLEKFMALAARNLAASSKAKTLRNPIALTPAVLAEGRAHWADHCAVCHANDGSGNTEMGRHMYPRAPDMRSSGTQSLTDGELFFIIENGIRLSGMPGWGGQGTETDSWKLVHFTRRLPSLQPEELREMERLNPKGPEERKEEQEEEEFLKGDNNK